MKTRSSVKSRRLVAACVCVAAVALVAVGFQSALAQGGPPLVTDDPETPGDGHWEINLATIGARTSGRWEIVAPDADINYGLGEHIQLKLDIPWNFVHETDQGWKSGLGAGSVGIKWRFVDIEDSGFSMSTYPQLTWNWLSSSARRGITAAGRQLFLPVEASTVVNEFGLDAEVGRNFAQHGPNQWLAGATVAHSCGQNLECVGEVRETFAPHDSQTLVNFGVHLKLNESLVLLAAAGREFGPRTDDQQWFRFYFGLQLLR